MEEEEYPKKSNPDEIVDDLANDQLSGEIKPKKVEGVTRLSLVFSSL